MACQAMSRGVMSYHAVPCRALGSSREEKRSLARVLRLLLLFTDGEHRDCPAITGSVVRVTLKDCLFALVGFNSAFRFTLPLEQLCWSRLCDFGLLSDAHWFFLRLVQLKGPRGGENGLKLLLAKTCFASLAGRSTKFPVVQFGHAGRV